MNTLYVSTSVTFRHDACLLTQGFHWKQKQHLRYYKSVQRGNLMLVRVACLLCFAWPMSINVPICMSPMFYFLPSPAAFTKSVILFMISIFNGAHWVIENPSTSLVETLLLRLWISFYRMIPVSAVSQTPWCPSPACWLWDLWNASIQDVHRAVGCTCCEHVAWYVWSPHMEDGEDLQFRSIYLSSLQDVVGYSSCRGRSAPKVRSWIPF